MRKLTHEQRLRIVSRAWGKQSGYCFFPWIRGTSQNREERIKSYHEGRAFLWPDDKADILAHMAEHEDDDLYWCPSLFERKRRNLEFAMDEHALWADLDETDPRTIDDYPPTVAWESSPGRYQALWLLQSGTGDLRGSAWQGGENQRLTYHIGADPAGWDITQLLRFPGWRNHKFEYWGPGKKGPKFVEGDLLWTDGRLYLPDEFEDLPEVERAGVFEDILVDQIQAVDVKEVWGRVRLRLSSRVRELVRAKEASGDRSEILWQIERDLADAGCTAVEIVAIVRDSAWNKYDGRQDELRRLTVEAGKAIAARSESVERKIEKEREEKPKPKPLFELLRDIQPPRWLVEDIWTEGACGFIAGQPKTFKSWTAIDLALSVSSGIPFLDQFRVIRPGPVLYIQEEDGLPTLKDRVNKIWPGKQADRVVLAEDGTVEWLPRQEAMPTPAVMGYVRQGFVLSDVGWQAWLDEVLEDGFEGVPYRMLVIDPLMMVAGDVDDTRAQEMTENIFKPLKVLAEKFELAIPVVHHMRKGSQYRGRSGGGKDGESDYERGGQMMLGSVANHAWADDALYVRLTRRGVHVEVESKTGGGGYFTVSNLRSRGWSPRTSKFYGLAEDAAEIEEAAGSETTHESSGTNGSSPGSNRGYGGGKYGGIGKNYNGSKSPVLQAVRELGDGVHTRDDIANILEKSISAPGMYQQLKRLTNAGLLTKEKNGWRLTQKSNGKN